MYDVEQYKPILTRCVDHVVSMVQDYTRIAITDNRLFLVSVSFLAEKVMKDLGVPVDDRDKFKQIQNSLSDHLQKMVQMDNRIEWVAPGDTYWFEGHKHYSSFPILLDVNRPK